MHQADGRRYPLETNNSNRESVERLPCTFSESGSFPLERRQPPQRIPAISHIRMLVQAGFALLCLIAGFQFYGFYQWATGHSTTYIDRPPSVEGFLPISALLGLKRLVLTGKWDEVHPAGLTILVFALVTAIFLRKGFCGWICPVGFVSNILGRLGKKLGIAWTSARWLHYPLLGIKYLILGFFFWIILWGMDIRQIEAFLYSQYNLVADAKMLLFFIRPSALTLQVLGILVLISLVLQNFWCRYLCPYGALLGLAALMSPVQIKRKASTCTNCRKCDKVCPASIRISAGRRIHHPECIGCGECLEVCPQKECLSLSTSSGKSLSMYVLPIAVVGIFLLFWISALFGGYWQTRFSPEVFRHLYPAASSTPHP